MSKRKANSVDGSPIGTVETTTGEFFRVTDRLDDGESGVVYRALSEQENKRKPDDSPEEVAVKFYLFRKQRSPFVSTAQALWMAADADKRAYDSERKALQKLNHPGIQEVIGWGHLDDATAKLAGEAAFEIPSNNRVQFLVSRFIKGKKLFPWIQDIAQRFQQANSPERHRLRTLVINCLQDLLNALVYLHEECQYQHSDIQSANVLIEEKTERPVLIDFGYSQVFSDAILSDVPFTRVPPVKMLGGPDELEHEISQAFGTNRDNIEREKLRGLLFPGLDLYQFGQLLKTLLETVEFQRVVSPLDLSFLRTISNDLTQWSVAKQIKTSTVRNQLRKLSDGYWSAASTPHAPELAPGHPVRVIALSDRSFLATELVEKLLETRGFRRLQRLKQLSLLDYVYPGATQTRFDHSLAVYSNAVDLVSNLARSPRFTKLFDTNSATLLLATALLHDINHFPFLHYCQEVEFGKNESLDLFHLFMDGEVTRDKPSIAELLDSAGVKHTDVLEILKCDYSEIADPCKQVIKSIVDSGVDVDKMAYVPGDSRATGVPFGLGVDRRALLSSADIFVQRSSGGRSSWHLCFEPWATSAVESLLLARYWNFKRIYWHHTNRAIGAMVSHVLRKFRDARHLTLRDYVAETVGFSDSEALRYLDEKYTTKFGETSVLHGLDSKRAGIFKRLLGIRAPIGDERSGNVDVERRGKIYDSLKALDDGKRVAVVEKFAIRLQKEFPSLSEPPIVLLDFPGRELDKSMGSLYIVQANLDGTPKEIVNSPFVRTLKEGFVDLTRTVRLFVPGAVREQIGGKGMISTNSHRLEELLELAIDDAGFKLRTTVG